MRDAAIAAAAAWNVRGLSRDPRIVPDTSALWNVLSWWLRSAEPASVDHCGEWLWSHGSLVEIADEPAQGIL